ncbi:MAG: 4Fe-4S binding protein [Desulfobacterales bacterium]|jgi:2-oxoglutarate ferredoxin oxidoreductase subunit delta
MAVWIVENICKGCGICVYRCPKGVLGISDRRNVKGINIIEAVNHEKCVACGTCEINCPDLAICAIKENEAEDS